MNDIHPERPVCVPCARSMTCLENGVLVRLTEDQIAAGDLFECGYCGQRTVVGFGATVHRWETKDFPPWDKAMGGARIFGPRSQTLYARTGVPA